MCLKRTNSVCKWIHFKIFTNFLYEYWRQQNNSRKNVRPDVNYIPPHFVCGSMTKVWIWCLITWYLHVYRLLTVDTKQCWLSWFIGWCHICRTETGELLTPKVKWSLYGPGVAQRVGRVIALLFHDRGTRRLIHTRQLTTIHTTQLQQYTQDNYNNTHKTTNNNTHKTTTTIHTRQLQQYTQDN